MRTLRLPLLALLAIVALVAAGCGDKTKTITETNAQGQKVTRTVPDVHFAKTKFVLHSGLALGAFHRYLYKPYRAGSFQAGTPGRTKAFVKGALATAFIVHEMKQAKRAALSDDKLRPLADKIQKITDQVQAQAGDLKNNVLNGTAFTGIDGLFSGFLSDAEKAGATVKERAVPTLGP